MNHKTYLAKDKKLKPFLKNEIVIPSRKNDITLALVDSILSQQLSIRVAQVMSERFRKLFKGKPTAAKILEVPVDKIRAIGISNSKASYIHNVAQFMVERKISTKKIEHMSDDEVIELLTEIKGVGRWTVEMILIFTMGRQDVFAVDDLGVMKGMHKIFPQLLKLPKKEQRLKMMELSQRWSPYRTYVCLYFWNYQGFKE